jgi:serine/threonine protein phosphatase 1
VEAGEQRSGHGARNLKDSMQSFPTRISGPVAVIGDLHGQSDQLESLLNQLERLPDFRERWVVFLGDLIDRGPDSRGVIDRVLDLMRRHPRTCCLCGNHELQMLRALAGSNDSEWLRGYGAAATFASYGAAPGDLDELSRLLPRAHREFLANLPWCVEHPQYLFVHAGLDPNLPSEIQLKILRSRAQTTGRVAWLSSRRLATAEAPPDFRGAIVSGHVYVPEVKVRPGRILVGTTDGEKGTASAALLPELRILQAELSSPDVQCSARPASAAA